MTNDPHDNPGPRDAGSGTRSGVSDLMMFNNDEGWRRKCPGCKCWYAVEELINGRCPKCTGRFEAVKVGADELSYVPILDGHVVCPACRYAYEVATDVTDAVAECSNCHATFHIKATG